MPPRFSRRSTARIEVFMLGLLNAPCFCRIKNSPRLLCHLRRNRNQNRLPLRPRPALRPTRLSLSPNGRGEQEVMVFDTNKNKTKSYKLGDGLAGGTIVMIDYRQMPFPDKPALLSQSRVILSIKDDFGQSNGATPLRTNTNSRRKSCPSAWPSVNYEPGRQVASRPHRVA